MQGMIWAPLGASLLAALVTSIGLYTIRHFEAWGRRYSIYYVCFAAGVLISVSLLHIIPRSLAMNSDAPAYLLAGFVLLHLFNRFITAFVCERESDIDYSIGLVAMLGIGFHSFIDGFVYAITFSVSFFTGTLAAIGMVLHEFPEGIITYLLLLRSGFTSGRALLLAFFTAALSTPLGTLIAWPLISRIGPDTLGALLSLSAGALLYVGASHLLPQAEKEQRPYSMVALAGGILVAVAIVWSGK
ncbi:MAG: ZIP family metal transporter [Gammaproteobacteria bacterium]|nr:ZIP family metal transporter [Gammaproteobacteria bacterium]